MKKIPVFLLIMLASFLIPLEASETIMQWKAKDSKGKTQSADTPMSQAQKEVLRQIYCLPMPFTSKTVAQCDYTVQTPCFWRLKVKKNIYHAAIIFENSPDGIHSSSQRFLALFIVWKNGKVHYRRVIENDPERIKITGWELRKLSDGDVYFVLNYDFEPYFTDSFTNHTGKYQVVLPVSERLHASVEAFDSLTIGKLPFRNGIACATARTAKNEEADDRYKNPVYKIVFPHCYVVKEGSHLFHAALVDRQHEDLLTVYIWKDKKLHSVYLLDHYDRFDFTPDRLKINSGPGSTNVATTPSTPVFKRIFFRYTIKNSYGSSDAACEPDSSYFKHNFVTVHLKHSGTFDMRKKQFQKGFVYTPLLKEK